MPDSPVRFEADFLAFGGTEVAIFVAVRAARCGLKTVLLSQSEHAFGSFPSLGAWETHYLGCRAPLSHEVRQKIIDYYRKTYGENSTRLRECLSLEDNNPMVTFEPQVAEKVLRELMKAEPNLRVYSSCHLSKVIMDDGKIRSVLCRQGDKVLEFAATCFADCSYTGDLGARAGADFFMGRESRSRYGEPHAGQIFTNWKQGRFPKASVEGRLNLLPTWTTTDPLEGSTGEGDENIQDYSYRLCLSEDPENRLLPSMPLGYNRKHFAPLLLPVEEKAKLPLPFHHRWLTQSIEEMMGKDHLFHGHALPGRKRSWNATNFTGAGRGYPTTDGEGRLAIEVQHLNHAMGLLYFLQNDSEVPGNIQCEARKWGLARDEFFENDHIPPALYVREGRRFKGAYVYREQDCLKAEGLERAPIHRDGIAFTEFALDSLPCSPERFKGSLPNGQFFEKDKSRPGSLPYRCLLPMGISNLLVPTAPSVTHCAWGTVRQTSCLLHLAEVCALAVELSLKLGSDLADLPPLSLQKHLVKNGAMISFFNDFDMAKQETWKEAALLLGNQGFFADYDARPNEPLLKSVAEIWINKVTAVREEEPLNPNDVARMIRKAENGVGREYLKTKEFCRNLKWKRRPDLPNEVLTRGKALEILYRYLSERSSK